MNKEQCVIIRVEDLRGLLDSAYDKGVNVISEALQASIGRPEDRRLELMEAQVEAGRTQLVQAYHDLLSKAQKHDG